MVKISSVVALLSVALSACFTFALRVKSWSLLGVVFGGVALLSACGGGGGSSGSSATTSAVVTAYKGAFTSGTVTVKDSIGSIVATGTLSNSVVTVAIPTGASFPITVYATGTYRNEATGGTETTTTEIRSVIPDAATAASGIPVTALTEIAAVVIAQRVANGEALSADMVKSSITAVASMVLNMTYVEAMTAPTFNAATGKTSDPNALKLAALALSANSDGTGVTLADKVKAVASQIASGNAPAAVLAHFSSALTAVTATSGISSQQANSNSPTPVSSVVLASFPVLDNGAVTASTMKWDTTGVWDTATWK